MFPGSDLLADAFTVIDTIQIEYMQYGARVLNPVGQWVTTYMPAVPVQASVQAVPREKYTFLGLDLQKNYVSIFVQLPVIDIDRDQTGDRFVLPDGRMYQIDSQTDWYAVDGWVGPVICVKVSAPS